MPALVGIAAQHHPWLCFRSVLAPVIDRQSEPDAAPRFRVAPQLQGIHELLVIGLT